MGRGPGFPEGSHCPQAVESRLPLSSPMEIPAPFQRATWAGWTSPQETGIKGTQEEGPLWKEGPRKLAESLQRGPRAGCCQGASHSW